MKINTLKISSVDTRSQFKYFSQFTKVHPEKIAWNNGEACLQTRATTMDYKDI